jgi:hypothetical protein
MKENSAAKIAVMLKSSRHLTSNEAKGYAYGGVEKHSGARLLFGVGRLFGQAQRASHAAGIGLERGHHAFNLELALVRHAALLKPLGNR